VRPNDAVPFDAPLSLHQALSPGLHRSYHRLYPPNRSLVPPPRNGAAAPPPPASSSASTLLVSLCSRPLLYRPTCQMRRDGNVSDQVDSCTVGATSGTSSGAPTSSPTRLTGDKGFLLPFRFFFFFVYDMMLFVLGALVLTGAVFKPKTLELHKPVGCMFSGTT